MARTLPSSDDGRTMAGAGTQAGGVRPQAAREIDEVSRVRRCVDAERQDDVVAGPLALDAQLAAGAPGQRVEPVQRAQCLGGELMNPVAPGDVGELVGQHHTNALGAATPGRRAAGARPAGASPTWPAATGAGCGADGRAWRAAARGSARRRRRATGPTRGRRHAWRAGAGARGRPPAARAPPRRRRARARRRRPPGRDAGRGRREWPERRGRVDDRADRRATSILGVALQTARPATATRSPEPARQGAPEGQRAAPGLPARTPRRARGSSDVRRLNAGAGRC